jgi:hypothetical protein
MSAPLPKPAVLDDEKLDKVRSLEHQLGDDIAVVAYTKQYEPAELNEEQLQRIQQLERELGVFLVAWKRPPLVCE